jgi:hypothetical protein
MKLRRLKVRFVARLWWPLKVLFFRGLLRQHDYLPF